MRPFDLTISDLSKVAEVSESSLWAMARNPELRMMPRRKKMVKGKVRCIESPLREFKVIARRIHRLLQHHFPANRSVHGGAQGKSCVTSAGCHLDKRMVLTRDITNCYPSISTNMMYRALVRYGFRKQVSKCLSMLMTTNDWIPHGSPLSSDAINFFFDSIDQKLTELCIRRNLSNTRTYDDFTISGNDIVRCRESGHILELLIKSSNLRINEKKKKLNGIQFCHRQQRVHNLMVNRSTGVKLPDEQRDIAVRLAEELVRGAKSASPESLYYLAKKT